MIPYPDLIDYVCIAIGTTVLAEFNSKDSALAATAARCLEHTPPYHATFTHTVRSKTYSFLIDGSFVYFAIFDEGLGKSEGLAFLKKVKDAFAAAEIKLENPTSHCLQEKLSPIFGRLLGPVWDGISSPARQGTEENGIQQCGSWPIRERTKANGERGMNMKNRVSGELKNHRENGEKEDGENEEDGVELSRKFSVTSHRNGGLYSAELTGNQRAKRVWKKQVWIVLSLDLMICVMLFGVWLWVCRGLKCIEN